MSASTLRLRRRFGELLLAAALFPGTALAQTASHPVELFVGYSRLPADGDDFPRQTSHGAQVGIAVTVTNWFGVVGEFAAQFDSDHNRRPNLAGENARSRVVEYLVGPRFSARAGRIALFGHGLVGIAHGDAGGNFKGFSGGGLTFGGGAGFDVQVRRRVAIRTQFDALFSFADIVERNSRLGVGLVVGFGGSSGATGARQ